MTVPPQATLEATVAGFGQADRLGVDSAWFSQPPGGFDSLMVLALAARQTRSVRLGTAVIPTFPTHPLVTASAARTAAAAAPGRVVLGVGSGHRTWIEHEYGMRFDRPVRQVTEWIRTVRRLLDGEALSARDNAFGISAPGSDTATELPIVAAATGPQMLTAAAMVADGVLTWMCDEAYLDQVVLPAVARGAAKAERAAPPVIAGALICVCDDAERARAGLRPRLAALGGYDSYQNALSYHAPAPREPVDVAIVGAEAEVRGAIDRLAAAGASEVVAVVLPDPADPHESVRRAHRLLTALASEPEQRPPARAAQRVQETGMSDQRIPARPPRDQSRFLRSGEVATAAGINVQTLRYYERRGLLPPADRSGSGYRLYPAHTVTLVRMIKNAQHLGFNLDEITGLMASDPDLNGVPAIAARKLAQTHAEIARLTRIRDALTLVARPGELNNGGPGR